MKDNITEIKLIQITPNGYLFSVPLDWIKNEIVEKYKCLKCKNVDKICKWFTSKECEGCYMFEKRNEVDE